MSKRRPEKAVNPANRAAKVALEEIEVRINGTAMDIPPELAAAVQRAYQGSIQPLAAEMTTTQAAAYLDVSRPFVVKLIDRGELPCRRVGRHRRIPSAALRKYRDKMFHQAKQAADTMTRQSEDLGLYDLGGPPPKES